MSVKMRTLPKALEELKRIDPGCDLTLTALRRAVKTGRLPAVEVGSKRLVDMTVLENYLCGNAPEQTQTGIRRIL